MLIAKDVYREIVENYWEYSTSGMDSTRFVIYIFVAAVLAITFIGVLVAYLHY